MTVALSAMACSNKQIYTAVQENQRLECRKLPQVQYDRCMEQLKTPYEDYERERKARLKGDRT